MEQSRNTKTQSSNQVSNQFPYKFSIQFSNPPMNSPTISPPNPSTSHPTNSPAISPTNQPNTGTSISKPINNIMLSFALLQRPRLSISPWIDWPVWTAEFSSELFESYRLYVNSKAPLISPMESQKQVSHWWTLASKQTQVSWSRPCKVFSSPSLWKLVKVFPNMSPHGWDNQNGLGKYIANETNSNQESSSCWEAK